MLDREDEFYDTKIGPNIEIARHAMAIDERRSDFEPTIWQQRTGTDISQVWFAGAHGNVGGGLYREGKGGRLSDIALAWMINEARGAGLSVEGHLGDRLRPDPLAPVYGSRRHIYRSRPRADRPIDHGSAPVLVHESVRQRWDALPGYRPRNLVRYLEINGWPTLVP